MDILEKLKLARDAMAKLTSSRKPVMVSIPPHPDDADMLICGACDDAVTTIRLLRAEVRAWRSGFDAMKDVKTNLTVLVDGRHVPIAIGEALSFRAGITARSATDAAGAMGERR